MNKTIKYILDMKRFPFFLLLFGAVIFFAFKTTGAFSKNNSPGKYEQIVRMIRELLIKMHYSPKDIDDKFSVDIFNKYLDYLDHEKSVLLGEDVETLRKKFGKKLDDEINGDPVKFCFSAGILFSKRLVEQESVVKEMLAKPFDFSAKEKINLDFKKHPFAKTPAELKERLRKKLKLAVLQKYADLVKSNEKGKADKEYKFKTNKELEAQARLKTQEVMNRFFDRFKNKFSDDDKFNAFANLVTTTMDPHTTFFPPVDKRYFDEEMSGKFYGIGATLQSTEAGIKIINVLSGMPAAKSGQVDAGDIIEKVAEDKGEWTDLTGFTINEAVKVIRGEKNSKMRVHLRKVDGTTREVALIRDEIKIEQTFAKSAIISNGDKKIGLLSLPEFYADFNPESMRTCSGDIAKELVKLKAEKVDGIVFDLRFNGGGYLQEVVKMVGLFIKSGPVVQVKHKGPGALEVNNDDDTSVLYNGPLVVMVNEFSASASEIFAAAIQDYGRGVIIGSTTTYGKGTVQSTFDLNNFNGAFGSVKLTIRKFYRVNGQSTQKNGVTPDIIIPDQYEYVEVREKDEKDALKWDVIEKSNYRLWSEPVNIGQIKKIGEARVQTNPAFAFIAASAKKINQEKNKDETLNYQEYVAEAKTLEQQKNEFEKLLKARPENTVAQLAVDKEKWKADKDYMSFTDSWLKIIEKDIYTTEAVQVVKDIISEKIGAALKVQGGGSIQTGL